MLKYFTSIHKIKIKLIIKLYINQKDKITFKLKVNVTQRMLKKKKNNLEINNMKAQL